MSGQDESPAESLSRQPSSVPSPSPQLRRSPQIIEFIDSQDPNTKSAIQRHTAQHAAALRREARLQAVRDTKPRNLEWQRRPGAEIPATSGISVTPPDPPIAAAEVGLAPTTGELNAEPRPSLNLPTSQGEGLQSAAMLNLPKEMLFHHYESTRCQNESHRAYYTGLLASIRSDEACTYLFMAYTAAGLALTKSLGDSQRDWETSLFYKGKGHDIIIERLSDSVTSCSDANIQAVLLLIALVSRFEDNSGPELHINAVRQMVSTRGGQSHFQHSPTLEYQLRCVALAQFDRILECGPECEYRFNPS